MIIFDDKDILDSLNAEEIANLLTIKDMVRFFHSLGVTDLDVTDTRIIAPTVCHNPLGVEASKKLYWYEKSHLFYCYTGCETMTVYTFYMKFMALNYEEINFIDAIHYVRQFVNKEDVLNFDRKALDAFVSTRNKFSPKKQLLYNNPINANILNCFLPYAPPAWVSEGIHKDAIKKYEIGYCISQECITIPHYEYRPNDESALVGVRCRELNLERIEAYGKYHPMYVGDKGFNHHLSYCPYGLAQQQKAIKKLKRAIIVEGEKSVLKGYSYYGDDSIILASCGIASFGVYQINMLTKELGVTDICIAFDKEYDEIYSPEAKTWGAMLEEKCRKYSYCANMSYIFDKKGLLNKKDSPVDQGQKTFELLYKERIKVRK